MFTEIHQRLRATLTDLDVTLLIVRAGALTVARRRLDAELVRRRLARSRDHARELIDAGSVRVRGTVATKAATQVEEADPIVVTEGEAADGYVSRGAHKLIGALDAFSRVVVEGRDCLDAGASTGGFTQVLLERGATARAGGRRGLRAAGLARAHRCPGHRHGAHQRAVADPGDVPLRPALIVADLSFIPLELVLPALAEVAADDADLVLMVKPQFEVGRAAVGDGVVRDPGLRRSAVRGAWPMPPPPSGWPCGEWRRARCPGRAETSSTSSG